MKNKVLIVFKYPHGWNKNVVQKFNNYYDTEHVYVSNYPDKNFKEIVEDINNIIQSKNIQIVVFDVDYFKFINLFFIKEIKAKKKILITGDDFELHNINSITASECDLVLSHCPLSVLKYREKGYESYVFHFEKGEKATNYNEEKEVDVLFFGHLTPDRKEILSYIEKEGIKLKNVGHEGTISGLPENELLNLISKSKIVINLSKSRSTSVTDYSSEKTYQFYYQFKGRIILAGLNGAACVSEYSPGQELLYNSDEVPTFFTKQECVEILKKLLKDEELLKNYTLKFANKTYEISDDKNNFEPIFNAIEKPNNRKVKLLKIPHWYARIAAKQILLRNIKLSTFTKKITQFNLIFKVTKNSSLVAKLLITIESILNIIWYSLISIFKNKK
tara:strand:+ start:2188 stop:3354 length:1167 start_codon:yes stop_codon:yes gene_type:complete